MEVEKKQQHIYSKSPWVNVFQRKIDTLHLVDRTFTISPQANEILGYDLFDLTEMGPEVLPLSGDLKVASFGMKRTLGYTPGKLTNVP